MCYMHSHIILSSLYMWAAVNSKYFKSFCMLIRLGSKSMWTAFSVQPWGCVPQSCQIPCVALGMSTKQLICAEMLSKLTLFDSIATAQVSTKELCLVLIVLGGVARITLVHVYVQLHKIAFQVKGI